MTMDERQQMQQHFDFLVSVLLVAEADNDRLKVARTTAEIEELQRHRRWLGMIEDHSSDAINTDWLGGQHVHNG